MTLFGPSWDEDVEEEQATLSICQLIMFNSKIKKCKTTETPLPVYLGLYAHSVFRSSQLIDELAGFGLSVNYNRVNYLEKKMGLSVTEQFSKEGVVTPSGLRLGLYTVAACDNIDHNPSSRTRKESFHGTAISLFQSRVGLDDGELRGRTNVGSGGGLLKLPDDYVKVTPLMAGINASLPACSPVTFSVANDLPNERCEEENWARMVISKLEQEEEDTLITWSGYHASSCSEVVPCLSGLYPLFKESSTDPAMILHAMCLVMKSVAYLNPSQKPVITGDQPIYAIMKKMQWSHPNLVGNMVVMLGGFHIEKHLLKCLGDILERSGWSTAIVEAGIARQGTADALLKATHVTRSR